MNLSSLLLTDFDYIDNEGPYDEHCACLVFIGKSLLLPATSGLKQISWLDFQNPQLISLVNNAVSSSTTMKRLSMGGQMVSGKMVQYYAVAMDAVAVDSHSCPESFQLYSMRDLMLHEPLLMVAGRALQLLEHYQKNRYCGRCGSPMIESDKEHSLSCSDCQISIYPRISPCIIVLIQRDNHCLLACRPPSESAKPWYSLLAGFVEPGETLEQCLHREVYEEVKIKVQNIQYFGSQSWPFPEQLMVGFTADYLEGDIEVDGVEIGDAQWFHVDELPNYPPNFSISGKIIEAFLRQKAVG